MSLLMIRMFNHCHKLHHHTIFPFYDQSIAFHSFFFFRRLDLSDGSNDSKIGTRDSLNEDEAVEERLKLKRKLQRNRTSFTQEQIDTLEQGIDKQKAIVLLLK